MGNCSSPAQTATIGGKQPPAQASAYPPLPRDKTGKIDLLELMPRKDPKLPSLLLSGKNSASGQTAFADKPVEIKGIRSLEDLGPKVGFACKKGKKESAPKGPNQDTFLIMQAGETCIYSVFDGHGPHGQAVSAFAAQQVVQCLALHPRLQDDPPTALRESFLKVQDRCLAQEQSKSRLSLDCRLSGTTATLLLDRRLANGVRELCTAHCGDSRAVLGYRAKRTDKTYTAMDLTFDHKPSLPAERARIEAAGGVVRRQNGDPNDRVFVKNMMCPGLAMSRSIGDTMAASVGVTSEPDISVREVQPEWGFMLVCSDGVWEFITSQEAVDLVSRFAPEEAHRAAQELAEEARKRWLDEEEGIFDDITAVCVWLS